MKLRRFSGLSLRNLRARVQRTLLTAVGIVLGVGIVFGVLTLSNTMSGTFQQLFSRAYGSADLTVTAKEARPGSYSPSEVATPERRAASSASASAGQRTSVAGVRCS